LSSSIQFVSPSSFSFVYSPVFTGKWKQTDDKRTNLDEDGLLRADKQYEWIKQTLSTSTADWLFVVGHYPVWSIAEHGPTKNLVEYLKPLLETYKVNAYFCGHDHNMQYLEQNSVSYFLTGAAHGIDLSQEHKADVPKGVSKFHWPSKDDSKL
jgi:tartrate-resistant acid phosphatase type 5